MVSPRACIDPNLHPGVAGAVGFVNIGLRGLSNRAVQDQTVPPKHDGQRQHHQRRRNTRREPFAPATGTANLRWLRDGLCGRDGIGRGRGQGFDLRRIPCQRLCHLTRMGAACRRVDCSGSGTCPSFSGAPTMISMLSSKGVPPRRETHRSPSGRAARPAPTGCSAGWWRCRVRLPGRDKAAYRLSRRPRSLAGMSL
jgi:hypothetical protein